MAQPLPLFGYSSRSVKSFWKLYYIFLSGIIYTGKIVSKMFYFFLLWTYVTLFLSTFCCFCTVTSSLVKLYKWWHVVLLSSGVEYTISIAPFPYRKPEGEVVRCGAGSSSSSSPPRSEWLVVGEGGVRSIVHNLEAIRYGAEPSAVFRIRIQGPSGSGSWFAESWSRGLKKDLKC